MTAEYTIPGMHIRDHEIEVPLDWSRPADSRSIVLFAREVVDPTRKDADLPLLVFFQGGPGGKSPRPTQSGPGWLVEALKTYRVILPDQRGTGRSSRVEGSTMRGFASGREAGDFLACFRADSIVRDFEHLRKTVFGEKRWVSLGQSYGGFITLTYLSQAPEGLSGCLVTGGLAGIRPSADELYRRTYPRVEAKNEQFYRRYPADIVRIGAIADHIAANRIVLPDGDQLTVRRFQTIGIDLGMKPGFENIHWLVDEAFLGRGEGPFTEHFLAEVMRLTSYDSNPLFVVLHESLYGEGPGATAWAADRVRQELPQFAPERRPLLFTGEMMFPWMLEEIRSLRDFRAGAEALAARDTYSALYDLHRLAANDVPVVAAIYFDDMYVDADLSLETARHVGNLDYWITNEYEHDGLRADVRVFKRLHEMFNDKGGAR
ncbi:alpha/beta fold hydrolase [Devosia sp.]|uniref:alpha/beta fold hydrolase n=1 Tax=Devosia sp. TaxID=1871048 RepID=UPI001AC0B361|nr:alpha/beta fold hydrolase [Devosia sp.]MBN9335554.1 alpha/beta fold hydrolase [Devosia sp.]